MPSIKCFLRPVVVAVFSCQIHALFFAQELRAEMWGRIGMTSFGDVLNNNEPSLDGGINPGMEGSFGLAPEVAAGYEALSLSKLSFDAFLMYQHYWIGMDGRLPNFAWKRSSKGIDNLLERRYISRVGARLRLSESLETGISAERFLAEASWQRTLWNSRLQVEFFPWFSWQWHSQHKSYVFAVLARSINHTDDEKSFKIEPQQFSDLSLRLSHIYTYSYKFRFAGELFREKLLYEDFGQDHQKRGASIASEWTFLPMLSLNLKLGLVERQFIQAWKKVAGCQSKVQGPTKSTYPHDPQKCQRWELESFYQVGLNWDIDTKLSLSASYSLTDRGASDPEFVSFRQLVLMSLSWQTDKSPLRDRLSEFLPWGFRELYN